MIKLKNILKYYNPKKDNKVIALNDISLDLENKGLVFLIGKSGSGKSTLLNIIGCLDKADSGTLTLNGKNTLKFKNKELDAYRNTCVGFIFQDYNLIEEYDVYQNVKLALNLQKKKNDCLINQVLSEMGIKNLAKRKINELSGGEKQRVAIARAIVKNPYIILADEPTGNLDSKTSEQILFLLKEISKKRLVIIVSHNKEASLKYGDRIIEMADGRIINDTVKNISNVEDKIELINSRLPFTNIISMAFSNLKKKTVKLIFTCLLVTFSLTLFGMATVLSYFNMSKTHAEAMILNNTNLVKIKKHILDINYSEHSPALTFTFDEVLNIEKKVNKTLSKTYSINENNSTINLNLADLNTSSSKLAYYHFSLPSSYFTIFNEKEKVLGNSPKLANEIVISKVFADYIILKGAHIINEDNKYTDKILEIKNYQELLNSKAKLKFGSTYLTVVGILDEDLNKYEYLKNKNINEVIINKDLIYDSFKNNYITNNKIATFYVNENFINNTDFLKNNTLSDELFKSQIKANDINTYSLMPFSTLTKEKKIFNGEANIKISSLGFDEVIIPIYYLEQIDKNFNEELMKILNVANENHKILIDERNRKVLEQEKMMEKDENYVFIEIPPIAPLNTKLLIEEFTKDYIVNKKIIGSTFTLLISDINLRLGKEKTYTYQNLKIVGINLNQDDSIEINLSNEILEKFLRDNFEVSSLYLNESNINNLEEVFTLFPQKNSQYTSQTIYSDKFISLENDFQKVSIVAYYCSYIFLIFAVILFSNLIITSVNANKKKIGILRAIGTKSGDVMKIFVSEALIIGLISFTFSNLLCIFTTIIGNNIISNNLGFMANPIIFRPIIIIWLIAVIILVVILSSVIPIFKIARTKPIEAINNK